MPRAEGAAGQLAVRAIHGMCPVDHAPMRRLTDHQAVQTVAAMAAEATGIGHMRRAGRIAALCNSALMVVIMHSLMHRRGHRS